MHSGVLRRSALVACAALLATGVSFAQSLVGTSRGAFFGPTPAGVTIYNPSAGTHSAYAEFYSGEPVPGTVVSTGVIFTGTMFNPLTVGFNGAGTSGPVGVGNITFVNGTTIEGTTAETVKLSLALDFTDSGGPLIVASNFMLTLDGGAAGGGFVDNRFSITPATGGSFKWGGQNFVYTFSVDGGSRIVPESLGGGFDFTASANLYVTISTAEGVPAVPEPAAAGWLAGAAGLVVAGMGRRRCRRG